MLKALWPPLSLMLFGVVLTPFTLAGIVFVIWGAADTLGRYKDYLYLSSFEYLGERLALFYGRSFCGRNIVRAIEPAYGDLFHLSGYRWYHIVPDGFPAVLFNRRFWVTLVKGHVS
jgi:hypothetical protein